MTSCLSPIGFISSCYKEKFGIPRQPNLVPAATAELVLNKEFGEESIRGLDGFSHIWINFIFHQTQEQGWKPMVRPPRLGGNEKVGVFASRSTFRPNSLGLSVVSLLSIEVTKNAVVLHLSGCDLVEGTPVLDIKPYLPYVDSIPNANSGFAENEPEIKCEVVFTPEAKQHCKEADRRLNKVPIIEEDSANQQSLTLKNESKNMLLDNSNVRSWIIKDLIIQILQLDPRPSYQSLKANQGSKGGSDRIYAMKLYDFDLKWKYTDKNKIKVIGLIIQG